MAHEGRCPLSRGPGLLHDRPGQGRGGRWLAVTRRGPAPSQPSEILHDASLELLKLYSTEDRWEDAYVIIWRAYEEASPVDHPILLSMRFRSELERVAPAESIVSAQRYVAADPTDWEPSVPWLAPS